MSGGAGPRPRRFAFPRSRWRRSGRVLGYVERSLALDRQTAEVVRQRPELIQKALSNLDRWEAARGTRPAFTGILTPEERLAIFRHYETL